ncbi:hypothetical protein FGB62_62g151 [Gracilaria domingensis]|nr:hypothetical protein FGB62_62g151 [Gracilaria domingensis]
MMACFKGKGVYAHKSTHIMPIQIQRTIPVDSYEIPAWFEVRDTDSLIYQQSEILSFQLGQMLHLSQEREHLSFQIDKETSLSASKRRSFDVLTKKTSKKIKKMKAELAHVTKTLEKLLCDKHDTEKRIDLLRLFRVKALTHESVEKMELESKEIRDYAEEISKNARMIKHEIEQCNSSISEKEEQLLKSEEVLKKYEEEKSQVSLGPSDPSEEVQKLIKLLKKRIESLFECIHELEKLNLLIFFPFKDPRKKEHQTQNLDLREQLSCFDKLASAVVGSHVMWECKSEQASESAVRFIRTRDDAIRKLQSLVRELVKDLRGLRANPSTGSPFVSQIRERSQCKKVCLAYFLCQELANQCDYIAFRACLAEEPLPLLTRKGETRLVKANDGQPNTEDSEWFSLKETFSHDTRVLQESIVSGARRIKKAKYGSVERQRRLAQLSAELVQHAVEGISSPIIETEWKAVLCSFMRSMYYFDHELSLSWSLATISDPLKPLMNRPNIHGMSLEECVKTAERRKTELRRDMNDINQVSRKAIRPEDSRLHRTLAEELNVSAGIRLSMLQCQINLLDGYIASVRRPIHILFQNHVNQSPLVNSVRLVSAINKVADPTFTDMLYGHKLISYMMEMKIRLDEPLSTIEERSKFFARRFYKGLLQLDLNDGQKVLVAKILEQAEDLQILTAADVTSLIIQLSLKDHVEDKFRRLIRVVDGIYNNFSGRISVLESQLGGIEICVHRMKEAVLRDKKAALWTSMVKFGLTILPVAGGIAAAVVNATSKDSQAASAAMLCETPMKMRATVSAVLSLNSEQQKELFIPAQARFDLTVRQKENIEAINLARLALTPNFRERMPANQRKKYEEKLVMVWGAPIGIMEEELDVIMRSYLKGSSASTFDVDERDLYLDAHNVIGLEVEAERSADSLLAIEKRRSSSESSDDETDREGPYDLVWWKSDTKDLKKHGKALMKAVDDKVKRFACRPRNDTFFDTDESNLASDYDLFQKSFELALDVFSLKRFERELSRQIELRDETHYKEVEELDNTIHRSWEVRKRIQAVVEILASYANEDFMRRSIKQPHLE